MAFASREEGPSSASASCSLRFLPKPICSPSGRASSGCVPRVGCRGPVQVSPPDESPGGFFDFVFIPFHDRSLSVHTGLAASELNLTATSIKLRDNWPFPFTFHLPLLLTPCQQGHFWSHDSRRAGFLQHARSSLNELYEQRMNRCPCLRLKNPSLLKLIHS